MSLASWPKLCCVLGRSCLSLWPSAGIDLGEPLGNSHNKRNQWVERSGALWVWISSSGPRGHQGFPIRSLKVKTTGQQLGLLPASAWTHHVSITGASEQMAGLAGRRVLEPSSGWKVAGAIGSREQAALFKGRQKPNFLEKPLCCSGSSLRAAGACDSCTQRQRLF